MMLACSYSMGTPEVLGPQIHTEQTADPRGVGSRDRKPSQPKAVPSPPARPRQEGAGRRPSSPRAEAPCLTCTVIAQRSADPENPARSLDQRTRRVTASPRILRTKLNARMSRRRWPTELISCRMPCWMGRASCARLPQQSTRAFCRAARAAVGAIQRAIRRATRKRRPAIMQMEAGLDTGRCCSAARFPSGSRTPRASCTTACRRWGPGRSPRRWQISTALTPEAQPQDGVTYAEKDRQGRGAGGLDPPRTPYRQADPRASRPFPGAWTMIGGKRVKLLRCRLAKGQRPPPARCWTG